MVEKTLASGQVLPALGLEMGYVYLVAPISGILFCLFSVEHIVGLLKSTVNLDTESQTGKEGA